MNIPSLAILLAVPCAALTFLAGEIPRDYIATPTLPVAARL
jgi:hypothetical protein